MTPKERKNYIANFQKRRTSRVTHLTSGYEEQGFGDVTQNAVDSFRPIETPNDPYASVAREGQDLAWKTNVSEALADIYRAIENIGENRSVDDGTIDGLNLLASTMQKLVELPGNLPVPKAGVNRSGQTQAPVFYPANAESSKAGPRRTVTAEQLALVPEHTKELIKTWTGLGLLEIKP